MSSSTPLNFSTGIYFLLLTIFKKKRPDKSKKSDSFLMKLPKNTYKYFWKGSPTIFFVRTKTKKNEQKTELSKILYDPYSLMQYRIIVDSSQKLIETVKKALCTPKIFRTPVKVYQTTYSIFKTSHVKKN